MPYLTPNAAPGTYITRRLRIPEDPEWIARVNGALSTLTFASSWRQDGDATPEETRSEYLDMLIRYLDSGRPDPMLGSIIMTARSPIPEETLLCDGSSHLFSDYPEMVGLIPEITTPGGLGFTVPDMRGRFAVGAFPSVAYAFGTTGGQDLVTLTQSQMPPHTHSQSVNGYTVIPVEPGPPVIVAASDIPALTGSAGGGAAHENRPPYRALRFVMVVRS